MDYDIRHGGTYMYFKHDPLYPFGYRLSYTSFRYSNLRAQSKAGKRSVSVSLDVKNTGDREGAEVVQVYVHDPHSKVERPKRQLAGFRRTTIGPGQTKALDIPFESQQLAYWDIATHRFVRETGDVLLMAGSSSREIRRKRTLHVAH